MFTSLSVAPVYSTVVWTCSIVFSKTLTFAYRACLFFMFQA